MLISLKACKKTKGVSYNVSQEYYALFLTAVITGMRRGELILLAADIQRLSHKSPVIASDRRGRGDLKSVIASAIEDCRVASLLAIASFGAYAIKNGYFGIPSPHLPLLFYRIKTAHTIINIQPPLFHNLSLLMDNYTGI
jgi:hypothetical protein